MKAIIELVLCAFFLAKLLTGVIMCLIIIRWLSRVFVSEPLLLFARVGNPGVDLATRATLHCLRRWIVRPLSPQQSEVVTFFLLFVLHQGLSLIVP
jgi:hypothetical protein